MSLPPLRDAVREYVYQVFGALHMPEVRRVAWTNVAADPTFLILGTLTIVGIICASILAVVGVANLFIPDAPTPTPIIQPRYSSEQVVSNRLQGFKLIDLDNSVSMKLDPSSSAMSYATLILDSVPYYFGRPDFGESVIYNSSPKLKYVFDNETPRHDVFVGNRAFQVSLKNVVDVSVQGQGEVLEYHFGIVEQ